MYSLLRFSAAGQSQSSEVVPNEQRLVFVSDVLYLHLILDELLRRLSIGLITRPRDYANSLPARYPIPLTTPPHTRTHPSQRKSSRLMYPPDVIVQEHSGNYHEYAHYPTVRDGITEVKNGCPDQQGPLQCVGDALAHRVHASHRAVRRH